MDFLKSNIKTLKNINFNYIEINIPRNYFNISLNPTLLKEDKETLKDIINEEWFHFYFSMIGLYNDNNELLMVVKFPHPIHIPKHNDLKILIKYEI